MAAILLSNVSLSTAQYNSSTSEIGKLVNEYIAPLEKHDLFNGTILVIQDGKVLLNKGYGYASLEHQVKNNPNTRFQIASLSKPFTKLAIIQLAERKLLSLSDKVSKFIPDYPNGNLITIGHLLDHSSGIPHINDLPDYDKFAKETYSVKQVIKLFKNKPLEYKPGSKKTYSNSGYALLVHIIELISGKTYGEYLEKYIFQPAGMSGSGDDTGNRVIKNLARGYMMNLNGKGLQLPLYYHPSIKIGGGSLYSTTEDLYLFSKAYREGKLSKTTKPLYNQGIYGKSPGFNSSIWEFKGSFIAILSNNYSTPMKKVAWALSNLILERKYKKYQINEIKTKDSKYLEEYEGNFKIGKDIETIEKANDVLIEYENGDRMRGCRLIPIEKDTFFDTCYMEKLTFLRDEKGKVKSFKWESGDKASIVSELKKEK